ncbi:hypothetical protein SASPL_101580 [Salvia splendens]|uniref:Shikimate O-hydroxycinnamoyltransferase n=1 Tax=Salvia splendens TaxID=180675 RepID=A0A8X9ACL8_SALSN|nr:hypothetical protein SASPL_101580 [Salvia splendens]
MASFLLDCNNAGAEFTHAVASAVYISDIIHPTYIPEIVSLLFPSSAAVTNLAGIAKPLLAVQVTELADGIFIAFAANHAVVDGNSFWHFVKSWSEISRGAESISKSPVFNLATGDSRLIHLPTLEKNLVSPSQSPQRVFNFSREKPDRLKEKANSEAGTDKISTLQALTAHGSSMDEHSPISKHKRFKQLRFGNLDWRESEDAVFAGCLLRERYAATLAISASDLLERGLGGASVKINELISRQGDETARRAAEGEWSASSYYREFAAT